MVNQASEYFHYFNILLLVFQLSILDQPTKSLLTTKIYTVACKLYELKELYAILHHEDNLFSQLNRQTTLYSTIKAQPTRCSMLL